MFKIKNPLELNSLDKIVDDLVNKFNHNVKLYISEGHPPAPATTIAVLEQQWINELNEMYDHKAHKSTGRKVSSNWKEGKDNMDVRKRILNRKLDDMCGLIFRSFGTAMDDIAAKIDSALKGTEEANDAFFAHIKSQLPMNREAIDTSFEKHKDVIRAQVADSYPGGLEQLDQDALLVKGVPAWGKFIDSLTTRYDEVDAHNDEIVAGLQERLDQLLDFSTQLISAFVENMRRQLPLLPSDLLAATEAFSAKLRDECDAKYEGGLQRADADLTLCQGWPCWIKIDSAASLATAALLKENASQAREFQDRLRAITLERILERVRAEAAQIVNDCVGGVHDKLAFLPPGDAEAFIADIRGQAAAFAPLNI